MVAKKGARFLIHHAKKRALGFFLGTPLEGPNPMPDPEKARRFPRPKSWIFSSERKLRKSRDGTDLALEQKNRDLCKGWVNHHSSSQTLDGDYPWVLGFFIFVPMGKSPFF